jgi:hypothetical protein
MAQFDALDLGLVLQTVGVQVDLGCTHPVAGRGEQVRPSEWHRTDQRAFRKDSPEDVHTRSRHRSGGGTTYAGRQCLTRGDSAPTLDR